MKINVKNDLDVFNIFFLKKINVKKKKVNVNLAFNVIVAAVECCEFSSGIFPLLIKGQTTRMSKYSNKLPIYLLSQTQSCFRDFKAGCVLVLLTQSCRVKVSSHNVQNNHPLA